MAERRLATVIDSPLQRRAQWNRQQQWNSCRGWQRSQRPPRYLGRFAARRRSFQSRARGGKNDSRSVPACGVRLCSLLVVPDYHHQGLVHEGSTIRFLAARTGSAPDMKSSFMDIFTSASAAKTKRCVTNFLPGSTPRTKASFTISITTKPFDESPCARNEFRESGLKPMDSSRRPGCWAPKAERAARDAEMEYTTRLRTMRDLRSGESFRARSIVYSVRNNWRRARSAAAWNADAVPAVEEQSALAHKRSSARLFASGHLGTDCRSCHRASRRIANGHDLSGLGQPNRDCGDDLSP